MSLSKDRLDFLHKKNMIVYRFQAYIKDGGNGTSANTRVHAKWGKHPVDCNAAACMQTLWKIKLKHWIL